MTSTTLELGHGDVSIAALKADDGKHGVIFMADPNVEIGAKTGSAGRSEDLEKPVFLSINSARKESLDVLIQKLQEARRYFD